MYYFGFIVNIRAIRKQIYLANRGYSGVLCGTKKYIKTENTIYI